MHNCLTGSCKLHVLLYDGDPERLDFLSTTDTKSTEQHVTISGYARLSKIAHRPICKSRCAAAASAGRLLAENEIERRRGACIFANPPGESKSSTAGGVFRRHGVQGLCGVEKMIEDQPQAARMVKESEREDDRERDPDRELLVDR